MKPSIACLLLGSLAATSCLSPTPVLLAQTAQTLEEQLLISEPSALLKRSRELGNPARGAILFHGPRLGCATCHSVSERGAALLGPRLVPTAAEANASDKQPISDLEHGLHLIESILKPSLKIPAGYQAVRILTETGHVASGLLMSSPDADSIRLRDSTTLAELRFSKAEIVEVLQSDQSVMPKGLVNALANEHEFLDLLSYLIEIHKGGENKARELQPSAAQLAIQLPAYETDIDHRGFIENWDEGSLDRGREVYMGLCVNCHGTRSSLGSLATALRFGEGTFKQGSDPYSIYKTLTHGFGLMPPQPWMVPQQKYDVIHYLSKEFLSRNKKSLQTPVDQAYLASLPIGSQRGPAPQKIEPWSRADYGPRLINTYELGSGGRNIAYKGIALQLDSTPGGVAQAEAWCIFDHDTMRVAGVWTSRGFIDWHGIHFNGRHNIHPQVVGNILLANPTGPGWAHPESGELEDTARVLGRDGRQYGPLPRNWAQFKGFRQLGRQNSVDYRVGQTDVREQFGWHSAAEIPHSATTGSHAAWEMFVRYLELGPRRNGLDLVVATLPDNDGVWTIEDGLALIEPSNNNPGSGLVCGFFPEDSDFKWVVRGQQLTLRIPAGRRTDFQVWSATAPEADSQLGSGNWQELVAKVLGEWPKAEASSLADNSSSSLASVQPHQTAIVFPETVETEIEVGPAQHGFAVDVLTVPKNNPWQARVRLTGLDFFRDPDRMAVCTWDGDVWVVSGLSHENTSGKLSWRRIAFGLFQPLGLKIIDDTIYLTCRDQLIRLDDDNGDGQIDYYYCVNNDHQVTEHFHEFAMGLQTDAAGNFYYAKSARHALPALIPHHGTLLRVSSDGQRTDILANGFRAANGVCLNPDGTFIVTDQEGHWNPKNRINWVKEGGFYGNMYGYHDVTDESDSAMEQPLCWITNQFDRSPAELLWVDSPVWGPLQGSLLNLSYGYGKLYVVPYEATAVGPQGGMCALPIADLPTGIIRGRFSPHDQQLVVCGLSAWATSQTQEDGGLYRIRYTGQPAALPIGLSAQAAGLTITFSEPLGATTSLDPHNYAVQVWNLKRTKNYGSDHHDQHALEVRSVQLSPDRRTLQLELPEIAPTWSMEVRLNVVDGAGANVERVIHNTIHVLN